MGTGDAHGATGRGQDEHHHDAGPVGRCVLLGRPGQQQGEKAPRIATTWSSADAELTE